jgi:hypothetical protein
MMSLRTVSITLSLVSRLWLYLSGCAVLLLTFLNFLNSAATAMPDRYKVIEPLSVDLATLLENMKKSGKLTEGQFALGKTKVFLKNKAANEMDTLREAAFIVQAIKVTHNKIHRAAVKSVRCDLSSSSCQTLLLQILQSRTQRHYQPPSFFF